MEDANVKVVVNEAQHVLEEMEKDKPSQESSYWAKPSCKHCSGTGLVGIQHVPTKDGNRLSHELLCGCARKNWEKWKENWLAERKKRIRAERQAASGEPVSEEEGGNGHSKPKPTKDTFQRLGRLGDQVAILQAKINQHEDKIANLPQRSTIETYECEIQKAMEGIEEIQGSVQELERLSSWARSESERLAKESGKLAREASRLEQEAKDQQSTQIPPIREKIQRIKADHGVEIKELNRAVHKHKKYQRELMRRMKKLLERRSRIMNEVGLKSLPNSSSLDMI